MEVVARGVEHDEMQARAGTRLQLIDLAARAPVEGIVECVEVGTLRDGRAALVNRPVRSDEVVLQPRRRLDRGAVPDAALRPELALDATHRVDASRRLRHSR